MPDENPAPLDDLEPLPELDELEPLPELEELEPLAEAPAAPQAPQTPAPAPLEEVPPATVEQQAPKEAAAQAEGGRGVNVENAGARQRRESGADPEEAYRQALEALEQQKGRSEEAPRHLKRAAVITAVGCLLPWIAIDGSLLASFGSKLVVLLGAFLFHNAVLALAGEQVDKTFKQLAGVAFVDLSRRPKNMLESALGVAPTLLHAIAWLVLIGGLSLAFLIDPTPLGDKLGPDWVALAEVGMLAWAAMTFVHIDSYERGGSFSPIFPLMFTGHAIAGMLALMGQLAVPDKNVFALLGAPLVTAGGLFAMYTMVEAIKAARIEGELKKRASLEHRKLERARKKAAGS